MPQLHCQRLLSFYLFPFCNLLFLSYLKHYVYIQNALWQLTVQILQAIAQFPLGMPTMCSSYAQLLDTICCHSSQCAKDQCTHQKRYQTKKSTFIIYVSMYCNRLTRGNFSCVICRCSQIGGGVIRQQRASGGLPKWPMGGSM